MPDIYSKKLTGFLFQIKIKPRINKSIKSPFEKGIISFSADFEMAWAFRFSKSIKNATEMGLRERENFPEILKLFNDYSIPVSWATVGHLFLDQCKKEQEIAHPEMFRPAFFENRNWHYKEGDWYDHDPCTDYTEDPAWYAPDLIDKILESPIKHEIACHTFSHIDFSYNNCTPELAKSELERCKKLASNKRITLKSMVFPGGTAGNYEVLKEAGFNSYRKPMHYDVDLPYKDKYGLIAIPSSSAMDGKPEYFSAQQYLKMAKSFIDSAIKHKLVCHFWFHPSMNPWYLKYVLPSVLKLVFDYRTNNEIEILTMQSIANRILKND
ncbi:MAG: polysaccharide deacetylase family protein [Bacteroidales bacterium]|nr:polysaccharide deacetylase family protein [Bacteroidales bacterium]